MNTRKKNYYTKLNYADKQIENLSQNMSGICINNAMIFSYIPEKYRYYEAIQFIHDVIMAGQAQTFGQASLMFENYLDREYKRSEKQRQMNLQFAGDLAKAYALNSGLNNVADSINNVANNINNAQIIYR